LFKVRYKIWLEDDAPIFGDGLYELLQRVEQFGSISRASQVMKMSYREAWGRIHEAENRLRTKLLYKHAGGEMGGGAELTPAAKELMARYRKFREGVDRSIARLFNESFRQ